MTHPDDEPDREEAVYATIATFLRQYGLWIALLGPFLLISFLPMGQAGVLIVVLIYLGEAIVYAAARSRRAGARKGPGPALQALWVVLAVLLIVGGLFALSASGEPVALVAIVIGVLIVVWVWRRVARASGESTLVFLARIGRQMVDAVRRAITSGEP